MVQNKSKLIVAIVAFIIGVFVGQNFGQVFELIKNNGLIPSADCQYNGKTYKNSESFSSTDGCNICGCENGRVACTMMACDP